MTQENKQKELIDYALRQLKQTIEDLKNNKVPKSPEQLKNMLKELQDKSSDEKELSKTIDELASKLKKGK